MVRGVIDCTTSSTCNVTIHEGTSREDMLQGTCSPAAWDEIARRFHGKMLQSLYPGRLNTFACLIRILELNGVLTNLLRLPGTDVTNFLVVWIIIPALAWYCVRNRFAQLV